MVRVAMMAGALAMLLMPIGMAGADLDCLGDSACPGQRTELATYGAGEWHAATVAHEDGRLSCVIYARARNADLARGLWIFVYPTHLRFAPDEALAPNEFINIIAGDLTMPMAVNRGIGFVPLTFPVFASAVGNARALTLQVGVRRPLDAQEFLTWPMDGFRDAYRRIAEECAFDPSHVLGED